MVVQLSLVCEYATPILMYFTVPTAVTALVVRVTSVSSLQISWGPPEMLNGILTHYSLTVTSESDGSQQTWRVQLTEVNVTDLGEIPLRLFKTINYSNIGRCA